jgi:hypothetical protein
LAVAALDAKFVDVNQEYQRALAVIASHENRIE